MKIDKHNYDLPSPAPRCAEIKPKRVGGSGVRRAELCHRRRRRNKFGGGDGMARQRRALVITLALHLPSFSIE